MRLWERIQRSRRPGTRGPHLAFLTAAPEGRACFCGDLVFFDGLIPRSVV
jgi:hypothetical protein